MINRYSVIYILLLFCNSIHAQQIESTSVENQFLEQISYYPQEKIYVQTDRSMYLSGETIWFRAHLVDALLLKQANASRYVYLELIDSANDIVQRVKIRPDSTGSFHGNIPLDEELVGGNYSLRAYTRFMQNQGEDYFFRKSLYIANPVSKEPSPEIDNPKNGNKTNKEIPSNETFSVSFFPEGGYAPFAADIRIACKAMGTNGLSEDIKGEIFDDQGQSYATFETIHLGMGSFRMYYSPGRKYYAICTNKDNVSKRFDLPGASEHAVSLKMIWHNRNLRVTLARSPGDELPAQTRLIAHIRGAVIYDQPWDATRSYLTFEKDFFPAGIVHFLLVDHERNILSERLVFSSQESTFARTVITPDKDVYKTRDKVELKIRLTDENETPLHGDFALAIIDKGTVAVDTTSSIISTLLLSSELKGHIELPMSYLQKDKQSAQALDVLMMTQGWRRYDIPSVLKGNITRTLQYPVELSDEISGKAEGVFSSLKEGGISLLAVRDSVMGSLLTEPDNNGRFTFGHLEYPDDTRYMVQALTKKGSKKVFLKLDAPKPFPPITLPMNTVWKKTDIDETHISDWNEKYTIENGIRMYNLDEVVVTAKRKQTLKTESPYYSVNVSKVLTENDVEKWNIQSVFDLLRRIPGLTVTGVDVRYRNAVPMVVLDNVPEENFDYNRLDVNDIKDVFLSPPTSSMPLFGSRASGGAVVISTKKGFVEKNILNSNIQITKTLGYQQAVEFYSPVYATENDKNNPKPDWRTTIYWNPTVRVNSDGIASISFYTTDSTAQYGIVLEGVSDEGHLIYLCNIHWF